MILEAKDREIHEYYIKFVILLNPSNLYINITLSPYKNILLNELRRLEIAHNSRAQRSGNTGQNVNQVLF